MVVSYLAVGFAVLEGAWFTMPTLGLDEGLGRVVTGAIVLGFPFAVVLAWIYDLTPEGIVRTPDDADSKDTGAASVPPGILRKSAWLLLCAFMVAVGLVFRSLRV
jgi:hypothetical protein